MSSALIYIYLAGIAEKAYIIALALSLIIIVLFYCYLEYVHSLSLKLSFKVLAAFLAVELFLGVFYIAFPSQTTFYTLAAAEVGKEVEISDTFKKAVDLINIKLDEALEEENKR